MTINTNKSISEDGLSFPDKYDLETALEGVNHDDIVQGFGHSATESLKTTFDPNKWNVFSDTAIDAIDYGAQEAANAVNAIAHDNPGGIVDTIVDWAITTL